MNIKIVALLPLLLLPDDDDEAMDQLHWCSFSADSSATPADEQDDDVMRADRLALSLFNSPASAAPPPFHDTPRDLKPMLSFAGAAAQCYPLVVRPKWLLELVLVLLLHLHGNHL